MASLGGKLKGNYLIANWKLPLPIDDGSKPEDHEKTFDELVVVGDKHFTISALLDGGTKAIVYSMEYGDKSGVFYLGRLIVKSKKYSCTKLGPRAFDVRFDDSASTFYFAHVVPLLKPMRVSELTKFIVDRNMGDYVFNGIGMGCRYWCLTLLSELGTHGFVDAKASEEAKSLIEHTEGPTQAGLFRNFLEK